MLNHPTIDKLVRLKLPRMADGLRNASAHPDLQALSFEERLGLLVDLELTDRENRKLTARLRKSRLGRTACVEDIDYRSARGLDRSLILDLATGNWISRGRSLLITGPTGVGKSYLARALGHTACRLGFSCLYARVPRLFGDLALSRAIGKIGRSLSTLAKTDLLILDDFALVPMSSEQRHDLLEILEDRWESRATLVTSQYPVSHWHERIGDPTLADAILDRLIHTGFRIELKGDSLRILHRNRPDPDPLDPLQKKGTAR
uniref:AAA family ATPase n=1 Tax=Leptospirillum ferriphilum TaxID=178606 RepID=A0A7C3QUU5_9BACT